MSPKEYSPFTPGIPVPPDFFVGRGNEVTALVEKAGAVAAGRLERVFLVGERGIGKSSLAHYAALVAEERHRLLSLHVFLGGVTALEEMAHRVFERLLKDSIERPWHQQVREFLGNHVRQVGLFGITLEFGATPQELRHLVNDFVPALRNLLKALGEEKKGLMLILDDLNGLASSAEFAHWLKSQVDEMSIARESVPLLLVLIGLPERRSQLIRLQPSLARIFDLVEVGTLADQETREFFGRAFEKVNIKTAQDALNMLCRFSGGFPALAHEIGDATFKADSDGVVNLPDAFAGVLAAADVIGRKYIEPAVYDAIRSARYRSILMKLARRPFEPEFTRKQAVASLDAPEKRVFDNFLEKMKRLGVMKTARELGPGGYRFANELYYLFFWLEAQRAQRTKESD